MLLNHVVEYLSPTPSHGLSGKVGFRGEIVAWRFRIALEGGCFDSLGVEKLHLNLRERTRTFLLCRPTKSQNAPAPVWKPPAVGQEETATQNGFSETCGSSGSRKSGWSPTRSMERELGSILRGVDLALTAASSRAGDGVFELPLRASGGCWWARLAWC